MAFDVNAFRAKLAAQKTGTATQEVKPEEKKEESAVTYEQKELLAVKAEQRKNAEAKTLSLAERLAAAKNNKPAELEKPVLKETVPFTADNPIAEIQNKIN